MAGQLNDLGISGTDGNGIAAHDTTSEKWEFKAAAAHIADHAAPAAYSAHASGATAVTSNAATDLDTTAAALVVLRGEVATLVTKVNLILAELERVKIVEAS